MERLHEQEIAFIVVLQQFSPALDLLALAITFLGDEPFFLLALPLVYWCIDRSVGARLAIAVLVSGWANGMLKLAFDSPRPPAVDARIEEIRTARGGGIPSGHAQNTAVFWGYLAAAFRRPWLWALCAVLVAAVSVSRLYLGVHFPTDLITGIVVAAGLILAIVFAGPHIQARLATSPMRVRVIAALGVPGALLLSSAGDPIALRAGAALLGLATGLVIERRWVRFSPAGAPVVKRALAWLLGTAVLVLLWLGLVPVLNQILEPVAAGIAGYISLGLWVGAGAPALFVALGLYGASAPHHRGPLRQN